MTLTTKAISIGVSVQQAVLLSVDLKLNVFVVVGAEMWSFTSQNIPLSTLSPCLRKLPCHELAHYFLLKML